MKRGAMPVLKWTRLLLVVAVLAFFAYNGLVEGRNALRSMTTVGQQIATVAQLCYGVLAVLALVSMWLHPRATTPLLLAWAVPLTVTAGLAPEVYGGSGLAGALAGGLVGLVIAGLTVWGWRAHYRARSATAPGDD
jgi:hypothetical protein